MKEKGRILAIDFGVKRTGLAVTDPSRIIATGLTALPTDQLIDYIKTYKSREKVDHIVVGVPTGKDGEDVDATPHCRALIEKLKKQFPDITVSGIDESYTSGRAVQAMVQAGTTRKKRRDKLTIDKISAILILQAYLEQNSE